MKRLAPLAVLVSTLLLAAFAKEFVMPRLVPAAAMPFRDPHPQEHITFGADPYDTEAKASLFHPAMLEHSVLPVLIVFTNDGDQPIVLNRARFQLVTRDRAKADPYSLDDLRRAFTSIRAPRSRPQDQLPIPLPGRNKAHGGLSSRDLEDLDRASFAARAIEPHSSQQGFLFFDVSGLDDPARGARLFVTGATDARGHELMYFELPLSSPDSAQP